MRKERKALLVVKKEEPDITTLKELLSDKKLIGLFDGIIKACEKHDIHISIDPCTLDAMSKIRVKVSSFSTVTNAAQVEELISKYQLIMKQTPLTPEAKDTVYFITTDQTWLYSQACWYLSNGEINKTLRLLSANHPDNSTFGHHCQALYSVLKDSLNNQSQVDSLILSIKTAIQKRESAFKNVQFAAHAPTMQSWGGVGKHGDATSLEDERSRRATMQQHLDEAERELNEANTSWNLLLKQQAENNSAIWSRINDAEDDNLRSEIYYWLDYFCINYETLSKFTADLQAKGALGNQSAQSLLNEMPDDIKSLKENYRQSLLASRNEICKLGKTGYQCSVADKQTLEESLLSDSASIFARINVGALTAAQHINAAKEIMGTNLATPSAQMEIIKELRTKKKYSYLLSCNDLMDKDIQIPVQDSAYTISAIGLSVVATHGKLFPLSVKIVPRTTTTKNITDCSKEIVGNYWGGYYSQYSHMRMMQSEDVKISPAITFVDYGEKDITMRISACGVYRWLCNTYKTNMIGKGIEIDFQSPVSNKGGPSAGVTMAVSAVSSLLNKPILRNIAMTGDCRSDGTVHAIGGVYEKITAASASEGIELILVPRENDPDLLFIPLDTLCRTCIVECSDLSTYISAATDPDFYKYELDNLRKAQLLIRLGRFKEAEPLLWKVVGSNPNIYSAKRLLELLSCYGKLTDSV